MNYINFEGGLMSMIGTIIIYGTVFIIGVLLALFIRILGLR